MASAVRLSEDKVSLIMTDMEAKATSALVGNIDTEQTGHPVQLLAEEVFDALVEVNAFDAGMVGQLVGHTQLKDDEAKPGKPKAGRKAGHEKAHAEKDGELYVLTMSVGEASALRSLLGETGDTEGSTVGRRLDRVFNALIKAEVPNTHDRDLSIGMNDDGECQIKFIDRDGE